MPWYLNAGFIASDNTIQQPVDTNGNMRVINWAAEQDSNAPATNADATVTIGTASTETYLIQSIHATMICFAAAADRALTLNFLTIGALATTLTKTAESDAVSLQSGQSGSIYTSAGQIWLNDATVVTKGSDPIAPNYVEGGTVVRAAATNKNAGDRIGLLVTFLRVRND